MKSIIINVCLILTLFVVPFEIFAQKKNNTANNTAADGKKYPSLLWEITGNGLKKPSYLFGTMHISNKLVFNLGDSFYSAIKSVDVVALEQDPEYWQEAFSSESDDDYGTNFMTAGLLRRFNVSDDRLTEKTFSLSSYEPKIEVGLASEARMINGMLYRNNIGLEDFEEETYLDMYIYRLGHKLNKIVTGVENYKESDKLVKEAYMDMYKDRKNRRNVDVGGYDFVHESEDAYRRGDLDALDSLELLSVVSDAFEEKFLYKRSEIQANSIDTILKKHSLFVGVGAAHLPGQRGVIELLRKKGYILRPIQMGARDSDEKDKLEKIRVPVTFSKQYAEDSLFSVDVPGKKFYRFNTIGQTNMVQCADMPNGSYYMVTRIKTDAALMGNSVETVLRKTDSLLYENIPGKIISKKPINRNGLKGFDILNKTRKGDEQRYNIFVLPNEVIIFKVSGLSNYITQGNEADQFFASVKFDSTALINNATYQPPYGGFAIKFPSKPLYYADARNDKDRDEWLGSDSKGNEFFIFKTNVHQYEYIEADSFELRLMEESFTSSKIFNKADKGKLNSWNGYPVLDAQYKHTDGSNLKIRYLIKADNYFVIGCKYKDDKTAADAFINSFAITPTNYGVAKERKDTALGFTVQSPLFYFTAPDTTNGFSLQDIYNYAREDEDDDNSSGYLDLLNAFSIKDVGNDTTGEHIAVVTMRLPKYTYLKDSDIFESNRYFIGSRDSEYLIINKKQYSTSNNWKCNYYQVTDTGSSRILTVKSMYKNGALFYLIHMGDSISAASDFVKTFYETFTPADTFPAFDPFKKKSSEFFADYFSSDSTIAKKAKQSISPVLFDSSDLPQVKKAIDLLSWKNKNYLQLKKSWINIVGNFQDTASANYLTQLYAAVKDTSDLQNAILDALLNMRTLYSFTAFKDLVIAEPPALVTTTGADYGSFNFNNLLRSFSSGSSGKYFFGNRNYFGKWGALYDTLPLSSKIIPSLLDLVTLDDYKDDILELLTYAVDSGYVKADDYKQYFNKFFLDAKQLLKKQLATDERKEMNKIGKDDDDVATYDYSYEARSGNDDLTDYAVLLMPFWDRSAEVSNFFSKLLQVKNAQVKMRTVELLLKNRKPVPDSALLSVAAEENTRIEFYNLLKADSLTEKFPAKYKNQLDICKAAIKNINYYGNIDSLVYVTKLPINETKIKGWLYFFKYKRSKNDLEWKIAIAGLQPLDTTKLNTDFRRFNNEYTQFTDEVFKDVKTAQPTLEKLVKEAIYSQRESSSRFYNTDDYDDEDDDGEEVDVAKSRRYE